MKVKLRMANNQEFPFAGKVETIEADFNNETGNIAFRATFPNPDGLLRHGETGNILISAPMRNALLIPQKSTFEILEKKYVFTVDKNKVVHQKEISIGAEMPDLYVVKSGISAQDKIMLEGIRKVRNKDKLEHFTYQDPRSVFPRLNVYVE
jgi:membrane fusion protein (multidrug efflux system)